ncbi:MAG: MGMT family protein [Bdellovibrionales bacterium]|nr:MGMT family protein [Bdellovibrionales bacterium]
MSDSFQDMTRVHLQVPIGTLEIQWNTHGKLIGIELFDLGQRVLTSCDWFSFKNGRGFPEEVSKIIERVTKYFYSGEPIGRWSWDSLDAEKFTDFQSQVYQAILKIPHGETRTYAWVAFQIGSPQASRAVGQALRRNPFPILIPCHRVVGANDLGGFMGAEQEGDPEVVLKKWLLDHEDSYLNPVFPFLSESLALKSFV